VIEGPYPADLNNKIKENQETSDHEFIETESGQYLVVYMGMRNSGGYSLEVEDILKFDDKFLVTVKEIEPGADSMVTLAITYPYVLVKFNEKIDGSKIKIDRITNDVSLENGESVPLIDELFEPTPIDHYNTDEIITSGEIVHFEGNQMHVMSGCVISVYEGNEDDYQSFYIGQIVQLVKTDNGFDIQAVLKDNFDKPDSVQGLTIKSVTGKVDSVDRDEFTLRIVNNKKLVLTGAEHLFIEENEVITVEYIEFSKNDLSASMVLRESEKIDLKVKEVKRSPEGYMVIHARDQKTQEIEYIVTIDSSTSIRLNLSELSTGDDFIVYSEAMFLSYPNQIHPKFIGR